MHAIIWCIYSYYYFVLYYIYVPYVYIHIQSRNAKEIWLEMDVFDPIMDSWEWGEVSVYWKYCMDVPEPVAL